jgi:SHAQKYF class myb-like DNA-binding protein
MKGQSHVGENKSNSSDGSKKRNRGEEDATNYEQACGKASKVNPDDGNWSDELHKQFISAIFDIGLRNSSPAVLLENMTEKSKVITSERVKSKLQKYRKNKDKSRQDFTDEYDAFLARLKAVGCAGAGTHAGSSPFGLLEMMGFKKLLGGDAAAFLSYAIMHEHSNSAKSDSISDGMASMSSQLLRKDVGEFVENFGGTGIPFPELTEEEKNTSLGVSMTYVMGLFLSMTEQFMQERAETERLAKEGEAGNSKQPAVGQS